MNGAYGFRVYGFSSTLETCSRASVSAAARLRACSSVSTRASAFFSCPSGPKSRPVASFAPSTLTRRAPKRRGEASGPASIVAEMSQYSAETNLIRSRSRSTTIRVATDCTRPAESFGMTFFHSTGLTS